MICELSADTVQKQLLGLCLLDNPFNIQNHPRNDVPHDAHCRLKHLNWGMKTRVSRKWQSTHYYTPFCPYGFLHTQF